MGFGAPTTVVAVALTASLWGIGRIAHTRGAMVDELGKRSAELREARDERTRLERGTLEATMRGGRADALVSLPVLAVA